MKAMKFVIAPDSFKESVSADKAALAIQTGLEKAFEGQEVVYKTVPVADGGEGTMAVITNALQGEFVKCKVMGPLGMPVEAVYGYCSEERKAIIEVAEGCGLHLVPVEKRNPLFTTTFGVGEIIRSAIERGAKHLIIGLGGSGTNDGGIGMLTSLGAKFYDAQGEIRALCGEDLSKIKEVDIKPVQELLKDVKIEIACDVENPLVGPKGATYTFGPQKGADKTRVRILEGGMNVWASVLEETLNRNIGDEPKGGAAGGLGAAFLTIGGVMKSGVDLVLESVHFEDCLQDADYVITGEGSVDSQTADGKTISGITKRCQKRDIPVIVVAGRVADGLDALYDMGVSAIFGIVDSAKPIDKALLDGEKSLVKTAENIGRLIKTIQR